MNVSRSAKKTKKAARIKRDGQTMAEKAVL